MKRSFSLTLLGVCLYLLSGCAKTPTEPVYVHLEQETPLHAMSALKKHGGNHSSSQKRISVGSFPAGMKVRVVEWFRDWNEKGTDKALIQTICETDLSKCGRREIASDDESDAFTDVYGKSHNLEIKGIREITFMSPQLLKHNRGDQLVPAGNVVTIWNAINWPGYADQWLNVGMRTSAAIPEECNGRKCYGFMTTGELWKHDVLWKYDAQSKIMQ